MTESHTRLLAHIFGHLAGPDEQLPTEWIAGQINNLDRTEGDIDSLMARIAHVRTWTYITHRGDWVEGATAWQEQARAIEDRLSDALHDRITQRFVDRRSAFLVRRLASDDELVASVSARRRGAGRRRLCRPARRLALCPRRDRRDRDAAGQHRRQPGPAQRDRRPGAAARRRRRHGLCGRSRRRRALARRGGRPPGCRRADADAARRAGRRRLYRGRRARENPPAAGGLCPHRDRAPARAVVRDRGACRSARSGAASPFSSPTRWARCRRARWRVRSSPFDRADRAALGRHGVRFGTEMVYVEPLLRPEALRFRALLWAVRHGRDDPGAAARRDASPRQSRSIRQLPASFYAALGFFVADGLALRADRLERLAAAARRLEPEWPVRCRRRASPRSPASSRAALRRLLTALGYRAVIADGVETFVARPRRRRDDRRRPLRALAAGRPSLRQIAGTEARLSDSGARTAEPAARSMAVVRAPGQEPLARRPAVRSWGGNGERRRSASPTTWSGSATPSPRRRAATGGPCGCRARPAPRPGARSAAAVSRKPRHRSRLSDLAPAWEPLLAEGDPED